MIDRAIAALSADQLSSFVEKQRWFAAKGATHTSVRVLDAAIMPWGEEAFAIARVAVQAGMDGEALHVYQVPLAARHSSTLVDVPPSVKIGTVDVGGVAVIVYDAAYDADFRDGLAKVLSEGASVDMGGGARWVVEPVSGTKALPEGAQNAVLSLEQSNTSIVFADQTILKLFRRLVPGPNPDVEVTRFLTTRTEFTATPALRAEARFEDRDGKTISAIAQTYLPGAGDVWSYALERGRPYVAAPQNREVDNTFLEDAQTLGGLTRAMHEALASSDDDPDFAPEPATSDDLDRWVRRAKDAVRDSLALLDRRMSSPDFPHERAAEASALVRRRDHYLGWIDEIADELGDDLGMRARIHGDFHLGQILRTRESLFMVIDFEGEPSRTLEERREKTSPLRDVAGMLRSIGYAAATLSQSAAKAAPPHVREVRVGRWERDVRAAFLSGYLDSDESGLLPDEESHTRRLISLFETEKAFYELAYELNNRPAWAWIPMRGIAKLFTR